MIDIDSFCIKCQKTGLRSVSEFVNDSIYL